MNTSDIYLQDLAIDLDDLTEIFDDTVFVLDQLPTRSYEKDLYTMMDITVEMNLD